MTDIEMAIAVLWGLLLMTQVINAITQIKLERKISKLEREIEDLKQPTVKAEDLLTALERASHNTFNRN